MLQMLKHLSPPQRQRVQELQARIAQEAAPRHKPSSSAAGNSANSEEIALNLSQLDQLKVPRVLSTSCASVYRCAFVVDYGLICRRTNWTTSSPASASTAERS